MTVIDTYIKRLKLPRPNSHKSQNGKTLIIGGSDLFHAASQWSFRVISRLVDMTFYSSISENNTLLHDAKLYGTDGVIVPRKDLPDYLKEVDSALIGPGLRRDVPSRFLQEELENTQLRDLTEEDWENDTTALVFILLRNYPHIRWVIDAGAIQVLKDKWLPNEAILTPHRSEFTRLLTNWFPENHSILGMWERMANGLDEMAQAYYQGEESIEPLLLEQNTLERFVSSRDVHELQKLAHQANSATFIVKGQADIIWNKDFCCAVVGGNAGLTKGGTGDVLAGLIAGLVAQSDPYEAVVIASYLNKRAGHELFQDRGVMYNTSDLVEQLPKTFRQIQGNS